MMYHRGHAADFDAWVEAGGEEWSWENLQPFMDMAEGNREVGTLVSGEYHSSTGQMPIQRVSGVIMFALYYSPFIDASQFLIKMSKAYVHRHF